MLSINKLSIHFTGDYIFEEVSFIIGDRDRIGLVGKNGAGKSTLLKILHRIQEPQSGTVVITAGHRTGYLPQEMTPSSQRTVWDEALLGLGEIYRLEREMERLSTELSTREDYESEAYSKLSQQLADAAEHFKMMGGHSAEGEVEKVLMGLGFERKDFERKLTEFSTGWQMRVELAKILLQKPEVLLLDEPTNHLDIESIQWLENVLKDYDGALVLVSHDRAFLDQVTTRTVEINLGHIEDYRCNYSEYVRQRNERIELQMAQQGNQQKEIADIESFIERFRYKATKAKQVQSRIKLLEKMDIVKVDEVDSSAIRFSFPPAPHSGKIVVEANQVAKSYGEKLVLSGIDFKLIKGEKVAFVGRNGEGKTTFVRMIVGDLEPTAGQLTLGHQVKIGYFAQNQTILLNPDKTVFQTIDDIAVGEVRPKIRAILGSFLFGSDAIDKKVKVLSGGEKTRLALAKLLLTPVNLLILDEPTNHLDMISKDVLKNALLQYAGSLIIVSHDRDFLQGLTQKVIEFKSQNIKEYQGDIYDFLDERKMQILQSSGVKNEVNLNVETSNTKTEWERKKSYDAGQRKLNQKIAQTEKKIEDLHEELKQIEVKISSGETHLPEIASGELYQLYEKCKKEIEKEEDLWAELVEELENLNE